MAVAYSAAAAAFSPRRSRIWPSNWCAVARAGLVERLVERAKKLHVGNGLHATTEMGPCINKGQRETVKQYVAIGLDVSRPIDGGECAFAQQLSEPELYPFCYCP